MPLRIAQVATSDISIRLLLLDHIQALQRRGHHVVAICAPGEWVEEIRARSIEVQTVEMRREISPIYDPAALLSLAGCFRRNKFDVVHTHTPKAGLLGPLAARMAGVPMVVHTIHGLLFHDAQPTWRQRFYWLPEKFTATMSHKLLSQSREDMGTCLRTKLCSENKLIYLGNGIDVEHFAPFPSQSVRHSLRSKMGFAGSDFVIGSVGRLVYEKGFAELFEAAEMIQRQFSQAKFLVVGPEDPDQQDSIPSRRLRVLSDQGVVRFAGMQSEMRDWYALMDAFVLPSHREGIPRACMEAAAMCLPVIASDIRGCREVVKHQETGILVPMKNAVALAAATGRLIGDLGAAQTMGAKGRAHIAENFNARKVLQRLCDFYEQMDTPMATRPLA